MRNLSSTSENLSTITDSLTEIKFAHTLKQYELVANNINQLLTSLEAGEGSVGKILKNDLLYDRLDSVTNSIEILLNDIKQNPKRYVHFSLFGKKEKSENK